MNPRATGKKPLRGSPFCKTGDEGERGARFSGLPFLLYVSALRLFLCCFFGFDVDVRRQVLVRFVQHQDRFRQVVDLQAGGGLPVAFFVPVAALERDGSQVDGFFVALEFVHEDRCAARTVAECDFGLWHLLPSLLMVEILRDRTG